MMTHLFKNSETVVHTWVQSHLLERCYYCARYDYEGLREYLPPDQNTCAVAWVGCRTTAGAWWCVTLESARDPTYSCHWKVLRYSECNWKMMNNWLKNRPVWCGGYNWICNIITGLKLWEENNHTDCGEVSDFATVRLGLIGGSSIRKYFIAKPNGDKPFPLAQMDKHDTDSKTNWSLVLPFISLITFPYYYFNRTNSVQTACFWRSSIHKLFENYSTNRRERTSMCTVDSKFNPTTTKILISSTQKLHGEIHADSDFLVHWREQFSLPFFLPPFSLL